jgi:uncharacterized protein with HEPN domain
MSRDLAYLVDILNMARDARDFTANMDREGFLLDKRSSYAVIRCLEVSDRRGRKALVG